MHRNLLLTGATGALGPQLAAELLTAGAAERIAVLVRPSTTPARERFGAWLKAVAALLPAAKHAALDRLHPVTGDVSLPGLGIDPATSTSLFRDTDAVIHAAADTRFTAPAEDLWNVNVGGTRHALDWAACCPRLRQFLLVSSTYVAGSRTGHIAETVSAAQPDFVTDYQRTKWESERLALASHLPMRIARISLIMGSHASGYVHRPGALHNLIRWFGRGLLPMLPGTPEMQVDLIATETAAQCLARAVMDTSAGIAGDAPIWHIAAGRHAPSMRDLIDFVFDQFRAQPGWRRKGIPKARVVDLPTFHQLCHDAGAASHAPFAKVMESVSTFLPDLLFPKVYDTTRAESLWGGPLPLPDWRETLERVMQSCCTLPRFRPGRGGEVRDRIVQPREIPPC